MKGEFFCLSFSLLPPPLSHMYVCSCIIIYDLLALVAAKEGVTFSCMYVYDVYEIYINLEIHIS